MKNAVGKRCLRLKLGAGLVVPDFGSKLEENLDRALVAAQCNAKMDRVYGKFRLLMFDEAWTPVAPGVADPLGLLRHHAS